MADAPRPPEIDVASAAYRGEGGRAYHDGKRGVPELALPWVYRLRARTLQGWVGAEARVFELGVGAGWNLAALRCGERLGCDATDHPGVVAALGALGIGFVPSMDRVADGWADVALCHHTLEHLLDPAGALRELARILKPGGRLILHVPWERERRYARFRPDDPNHHLHGWNAQSLGNLVGVLGWRAETIRVRRYGRDRVSAVLAARLRVGEAGFRFIRSVLVALTPLFEVEVLAVRPRV